MLSPVDFEERQLMLGKAGLWDTRGTAGSWNPSVSGVEDCKRKSYVRSEIIIATYNKPDYLRLCLQTCLAQTHLPASICLADDGSGPETAELIEAVQQTSGDIQIRHSWHEDKGFRKCTALNKAVRESQADYLIFIDDDCLLHPSFVARHLALANPKRFLTGSLIRLSPADTAQILQSGTVRWTDAEKLDRWQPSKKSDLAKSTPYGPLINRVKEVLSPVKRNWQGACASTYRENILAVNGFDETMTHGGLDKEFGARLTNSGVKGRHVRYSAPVYHLDHSRAYESAEKRRENRKKIEKSRKFKLTWVEHGIQKT